MIAGRIDNSLDMLQPLLILKSDRIDCVFYAIMHVSTSAGRLAGLIAYGDLLLFYILFMRGICIKNYEYIQTLICFLLFLAASVKVLTVFLILASIDGLSLILPHNVNFD